MSADVSVQKNSLFICEKNLTHFGASKIGYRFFIPD